MKTVEIIGENYFGKWTHVRSACRGVVLKGASILLSYETRTGQWMLPGGGLEPGEDEKNCCIREVSEETGFLIRPSDCVLEIDEYYEDTKYVSCYFFGEIVGKTEACLTEREKEVGMEPRFLPLPEIEEIFSQHASFAQADEMRRGMYLREFTALHELLGDDLSFLRKKKLAVFFPGVGYTKDKPLLYYSRKLAAMYGYQEVVLEYSGFPEKRPGDPDRMKQMFQIAYEQSLEGLKGVDFSSVEDILFVGKSIGTIAAAKIASDSSLKDRIRLVLYTPLERTFLYSFGKAVVFTGMDDPWVGRKGSRIPALCSERGIPCHIIPEGNHSLECGDIDRDIGTLREILRKAELFIKTFSADEPHMEGVR